MAQLTTSDILKINASEELGGLIDECVKSNPEIAYFAASPITRNSYKTLVATALPSVGFRSPGNWRTFSDGTLDYRTVDCKYLDASWVVEKALAEQADWGAAMVCAYQAQSHLNAAFFLLAQETWYGTLADANGFNGLGAFINKTGDYYIDANPTEASLSDQSSVWLVRTGMDGIQYAWGSNGQLTEGEIKDVLLNDKADGSLTGAWATAQEIGGWVGLQISDKNAVCQIGNLSATASKNGLTDNLIYDALSRFPVGKGPTAIFMSRRSLKQLRQSRTATNATGAPAPIPTEVEGIPIYVTDAISNAESWTSSSSSSSSSSESSSSSSSEDNGGGGTGG